MNKNKNLITDILQSIGIFIALLIMAEMGNLIDKELLIVPFAASLIIVFTKYGQPISRAKNVIGGYAICAVAGAVFSYFGMYNIFYIAFAVSLASLIMKMSTMMHPPAGAVTIIIMTKEATWSYIIYPVITGIVIIVAIAAFYNIILNWVIKKKLRNNGTRQKAEERVDLESVS